MPSLFTLSHLWERAGERESALRSYPLPALQATLSRKRERGSK
jgi:hypothetical protein